VSVKNRLKTCSKNMLEMSAMWSPSKGTDGERSVTSGKRTLKEIGSGEVETPEARTP
jgi:hypothetical protein